MEQAGAQAARQMVVAEAGGADRLLAFRDGNRLAARRHAHKRFHQVCHLLGGETKILVPSLCADSSRPSSSRRLRWDVAVAGSMPAPSASSLAVSARPSINSASI